MLECSVEIVYFLRGTILQEDTELTNSQPRQVNDNSDGGGDKRQEALCISELSLNCDSSPIASLWSPTLCGGLSMCAIKDHLT